MKKRCFIAVLSAVMMLFTLSAETMAYAVNNNTYTDNPLWDKFIKYDLCITDYDSLTEEEKELCKFIFETERSSTDTIRCERARRILLGDEAIGERLTIEKAQKFDRIQDYKDEFTLRYCYYEENAKPLKSVALRSGYNSS